METNTTYSVFGVLEYTETVNITKDELRRLCFIYDYVEGSETAYRMHHTVKENNVDIPKIEYDKLKEYELKEIETTKEGKRRYFIDYYKKVNVRGK